MAGVSHDVLLLALKENPELLGELLRRAAGVSLPCPMTVGDSAVKFAVSLEKYPDLLFHGPPAPAAPDSAHGEEGLGEQRAVGPAEPG